MNRTDAPKKQPIAFGVNGPREDLPDTTPSGDNTASYNSGFPPITMTLKSAGGLPPKGQDMNQILYELSNLSRWASSGALNSYDAAFSTAISGYPKGSVLLGNDGTTIYVSTIDANTNDPNTATTGWLNLSKLTAIAGLAGGANKVPYFNGTNTAAQTDLTQVGRDIIGKSTTADVLSYLNLSGLGDYFSAQSGADSGLTTTTANLTMTPKTNGVLYVVAPVYGTNVITSFSLTATGGTVGYFTSQFYSSGTGVAAIVVTKGTACTVRATINQGAAGGLKISMGAIFMPSVA
ncbi:hypothetical protein [Shigella boydii]|uniref:hypothetical protein n=1 Tax=Shigella boydii TaxID=621 RepID=UPI000B958004|nr:hypothetical protein [Shigella boydii]OYJ13537.1 hypothetical protein CI687_01135 [Shigella boydii]